MFHTTNQKYCYILLSYIMITTLTMMVIMTVIVILMMIIVVFVLYHPLPRGHTSNSTQRWAVLDNCLQPKKKSSTSPLPIHLQNNGQKTWEHVGSVQEKGVPKGTQVLELDFRLVNHLGPWPCLSALPSRWNNKFKEIPRLLP